MSIAGAAGFVEHQRINRRATVVVLLGTFVLLAAVVNALAFAAGGYTGETCETVVDPTTGYGYVEGYSYVQQCSSRLVFRLPVLVGAVAAVAVYMVIAYAASPKAALSMTGARPATGPEFAQLRELVDQVAIAAGIPAPRVYVVVDDAPNAFATGHRPADAAVTVTTGLLAKLSHRELRGVIAHEMAHIKNRDIAVTTLAVLAVGVIAVVAQVALRLGLVAGRGRTGYLGLALLAVGAATYLLAVPAGLLLKAALSRKREALADATAIEFTREPYGLRAALEKLESDTSVVSRAPAATAHLWVEAPLERGPQAGLAGSVGRLFNTHPPLADRIAILRSFEGLYPTERGPVDAVHAPEAANTSTPGAAKAGWYPAAEGGGLLRWWNGQAWTSDTYDPKRPPAA